MSTPATDPGWRTVDHRGPPRERSDALAGDPGGRCTITSVEVGIVLGAGSSTRLGRPKQTLPLGETTVLGWVVAAASESSLERTIVVVDPATAARFHPPARCELAIRDGGGGSCTRSILAGLEAAGTADAAMLLLGDMPGLGAPTIDHLLAGWRRRRPWAAIAAYDDGDGHPLVFSTAAFDHLRVLRGDRAVWRLLDDQRDRVERIGVPGRRPADIDRWDDYLAVVAALAPSTVPPVPG